MDSPVELKQSFGIGCWLYYTMYALRVLVVSGSYLTLAGEDFSFPFEADAVAFDCVLQRNGVGLIKWVLAEIVEPRVAQETVYPFCH